MDRIKNEAKTARKYTDKCSAAKLVVSGMYNAVSGMNEV
jgi:hypothetical protein